MKTSLLHSTLAIVYMAPAIAFGQVASNKMQLEINSFYSQRTESFTETNPFFGPVTIKQTVRDFGLRLQLNKPMAEGDFSSYYGFFLMLNQTSVKATMDEFSNTQSFLLVGPGVEIHQQNWGLGVAYLFVKYPSTIDIPYGTTGSIRARLGNENRVYGILGLYDYTYGILLSDNTNLEGHMVFGNELKFDLGAYVGITGSTGETLVHPGLSLGVKQKHVNAQVLYRHAPNTSSIQLPYPALIFRFGVRI